MPSTTIRHLELRREVVDTPAGAELCTKIVLDGRPFTQWFAFLAGIDDEWIGWPDDSSWDAMLHGRVAEVEWDGRVELCRCTCSCGGCNPLLVRIEVGDDEVVWSDLAHGTGATRVPDIAFRFSREDYEQALFDFHHWDGTIDE